MGLKKFTEARIALGRTGVSITPAANLELKLAHAFARDAVYDILDKKGIQQELEEMGQNPVFLSTKATDRLQYLKDPSSGKMLDEASADRLTRASHEKADLCIVIADGLSATAVNLHAITLLRSLFPLLKAEGVSTTNIIVVEQGRVAISDVIGNLMAAKISMILIGERPGLSASDSMGVYLTYDPRPGNTDEMRNCVSNIRPGGLPVQKAADKIIYLLKRALEMKLSGVLLKDMEDQQLLS
jgi:ethanolamine ammonia-lyase small subunit